jgi:murein DD-endopeptidase MepM/ murein hydrolase activator NlpD
VRARLNPDEQLWLRRSAGDAWSSEVERIPWSPAPARIAGTVQSSIYQTLWNLIPDSVLPGPERDRMIYDLTDGVYGWEVDFSRDLVEGDKFDLLFERLTSPEGEARYGRLLAARLETRGSPNWAYVLTDDDGNNVYYDEQGRSLRRAFKLSPVPYRITSRYSQSRFHPILHTWRAHLGVDYRAPIGAPVSATADGTVIRAGRWGGYGIMVGIRHVNGIETRYAHLSRLARGMHRGARVRQGDVIGYAGMTGLATAPHVHYEFLKNGRHQNPTRVDLGEGTPVPVGRVAEFQAVKERFDYLLRVPAPRFLALGPD